MRFVTIMYDNISYSLAKFKEENKKTKLEKRKTTKFT